MPSLCEPSLQQSATLFERAATDVYKRQDLTTAIEELLADMAAGHKYMKVYKQMKMYNDPELNPVLYAAK